MSNLVLGRKARQKKLGLYLHIPYCKRKCNYCDFYSRCDLSSCDDYVKALVSQMASYAGSANAYTVDSVYIGGGTPTLLKPKHFQKLLAGIRRYFNIEQNAEVSCECNPSSMTEETLAVMKKCGINRLSIGVQSADDGELQMLGRIHRWDLAEQSYLLARQMGFDNINVDLMYSLPEQTELKLNRSIDRILALSPEHISLYGLKIEEGTPFFAEKENLHLPDEDSDIRMYFGAVEKLKKAGYRHYEISNFAKEGKECRHNLKYWNCDEYLGLGPAAASYYGGRRFTVARDTEGFIDAVLNHKDFSRLWAEDVDAPAESCFGDYVMLRFRLAEGVKFADFSRRFPGQDFEKLFGARLAPYVAKGLVEKDMAGYRLTDRGFYLSNYILSDILDFE